MKLSLIACILWLILAALYGFEIFEPTKWTAVLHTVTISIIMFCTYMEQKQREEQ